MASSNDDFDGDGPGEFDWLIGVSLSLMATLAGTVGKVMMKLSHNRALEAGATGKRAGKSGTLFYAGLFLNVVVNPVGYALAYNFASQSLIVPLSALAIVFNTFMAPAVLGEKLTKEDWYGALVIFCGAVLVGIGADRSEQEWEPEQVNDLYSEELFLIFLTFEIAWLSFLAVYMLSGDDGDDDDDASDSDLDYVDDLEVDAAEAEDGDAEGARHSVVLEGPYLAPTAGGAAGGKPVDDGKGAAGAADTGGGKGAKDAAASGGTVAVLPHHHHLAPPGPTPAPRAAPPARTTTAQREEARRKKDVALLRKLAWGSAGGTIGGNQFFIKAAVVYLENGVFDDPLAWVTYIGAIVSAVLGLVLMNAGLKRYEAVFVVPMYQSFLILFGTITAMTFFREFENYDSWQWGVWVPGVLITIMGILVLSLHFNFCGLWKTTEEEEAEAAAEEEEARRAAEEAAAAAEDEPSVARSSMHSRDMSRKRPSQISSRIAMRMDYTLPGGLTPEVDREVSRRRSRRLRRASERSYSHQNMFRDVSASRRRSRSRSRGGGGGGGGGVCHSPASPTPAGVRSMPGTPVGSRAGRVRLQPLQPSARATAASPVHADRRRSSERRSSERRSSERRSSGRGLSGDSSPDVVASLPAPMPAHVPAQQANGAFVASELAHISEGTMSAASGSHLRSASNTVVPQSPRSPVSNDDDAAGAPAPAPAAAAPAAGTQASPLHEI